MFKTFNERNRWEKMPKMERHSMLHNDRINIPRNYLVIEYGGHYRDSKESTSDFHFLYKTRKNKLLDYM